MTSSAPISPSFAYGADVSWLSQLESRGVQWVDDQGNFRDCLELLKQRGVNAIRLRVMVDPGATHFVASDAKGRTTLLGFCDQAGVVAMGRRCHALDLRLLVDFHLSDTWADPGHQTIPMAWRGLTLKDLVDKVAQHVTDVLNALKTEGIEPSWVQIGNEIPQGVLWGDEPASGFVEGDQGWTNLAGLLNAGYHAAKAVFPHILVVVHVDRGYDNDLFRWWFDHFKKAGGLWDVIGVSFYPFWQPQGLLISLTANLSDLIQRYDTSVMVCEVGGLATDADGTRQLLTQVKDILMKLPHQRGLGVFYWEPESGSDVLPDQYPLGASVSADDSASNGAQRLRFSGALDDFGPVTTSRETTG